MDEIESLCRLCEAVETAGADIAPTYAEYVQLAFAIATDCGEAGREFFHRLCRVSAKYEREHAERIFSNALTTRHGDVHLGTAFHLAERAGVTLCKEGVMNHRKNAKMQEMHRPKISHTRMYIIRWTMKNRTNPKNCRTGVTRTSHCPLSPKRTGRKSCCSS